jgi:hypothetical protein
MQNLNESEIIKRFIGHFQSKADSTYGLNLSVRDLKIDKPQPTMDFKDFKNGKASSKTDVSFELAGWKSYAEDGIKSFMDSLLDDDDMFAPVVDIEVFEVQNKGRMSVKMTFSTVYTGYDVETEEKVSSDIKKGNLNRNDIIEEIEIRLSEIYTLLKKLKG